MTAFYFMIADDDRYLRPGKSGGKPCRRKAALEPHIDLQPVQGIVGRIGNDNSLDACKSLQRVFPKVQRSALAAANAVVIAMLVS